jgi:hypothetical protein
VVGVGVPGLTAGGALSGRHGCCDFPALGLVGGIGSGLPCGDGGGDVLNIQRQACYVLVEQGAAFRNTATETYRHGLVSKAQPPSKFTKDKAHPLTHNLSPPHPASPGTKKEVSPTHCKEFLNVFETLDVQQRAKQYHLF